MSPKWGLVIQTDGQDSGAAEVLRALNDLLQTLLGAFGPTGTVLLATGIILTTLIWRWWADRKKQRDLDRARATNEELARDVRAQLLFFRAYELSSRYKLPIQEALKLAREQSLPDPPPREGGWLGKLIRRIRR